METIGVVSKTTWPTNRTQFRFHETEQCKKGNLCGFQTPVVVPIPASMFAPHASTFDGINTRCHRARQHAVALNFVCFALEVVQKRVAVKGLSEDEAFDCKLEALEDEDGNIVGHRLFIFQTTTSTYDIFSVMQDIVASPSKEVDARGNFPDLKPRERGEKDEHKATRGQAKTGFVENLKAKTLYKNIKNRAALGMIYAEVAKDESWANEFASKLNDVHPLSDANAAAYPGKVFNLATAIEVTDTAVIKEQRTTQNYFTMRMQPGGNCEFEYKFPKPERVLNMQLEWLNPNYFMTRIFPFIQLDPVIVKNDKFMRDLVLALKQKTLRDGMPAMNYRQRVAAEESIERIQRMRDRIMGRQRAARPSSLANLGISADSNAGGTNADEEDGDDDILADALRSQVEEEEGDSEARNVRAPTSRIAADHAGGAENYEAGLHFNVDLNRLNTKAGLTDDQVAENAQLLGLMDEEGGRDSEDLVDILTDLRKRFMFQKRLLEKACSNKPLLLKTRMDALRKSFFRQMDLFTMSEQSDMSDVACTQNRMWFELELDDLDTAWDFIDPDKGIMANWLIHMTEGLSNMNVATQHHIVITIYIGTGDRYRREYNLHYNVYIEGDASVGKSVILKTLQKLLGEDTTHTFTAQSSKSSAVHEKKCDTLGVCEEHSLRKGVTPRGDGETEIMRNMLTTMRYNYDVFTFKSLGNGRERERTVERVNGVNIGCLTLAGNEPFAGVIEEASKSDSSIRVAGEAYMSRFHVIDASKHQHLVRNIRSAEAAAKSQSKESADAAEKFQRSCIKADIMRRRFQNAMYIGLTDIDMTAFNEIFPKIVDYLASIGIRPKNERVATAAFLFCRQLVLLTAYHATHNVADAVHRGKKFEMIQLDDWNPCCTYEHVLHTFGHFQTSFIPTALADVRSCLMKLRDLSFTNHDERVAWETPHGTNQKRLQRKRDDDVREARENQKMITSYAKSLGRRPHDVAFGIPAGPGSQAAAGLVPHPPPPPPLHPSTTASGSLDASWLQICMRERDLINQMTMMMSNSVVIHGYGALKDCLDRLKKWKVTSFPYTVSDPYQSTPTQVTSRGESSDFAIRTTDKSVFVNTALLDDNFHYNKTVEACFETLCFKHTIPQVFISGRPHPDHPWVYDTIRVAPVPDRNMYIIDPTFRTRPALLAKQRMNVGAGSSGDDEADEQSFVRKFVTDFDSTYAESFLRRKLPPGQEPTAEDILKIHPYARAMRIKKMYEDEGIDEFSNYPADVVSEASNMSDVIRRVSNNTFDEAFFMGAAAKTIGSGSVVSKTETTTADAVNSLMTRLTSGDTGVFSGGDSMDVSDAGDFVSGDDEDLMELDADEILERNSRDYGHRRTRRRVDSGSNSPIAESSAMPSPSMAPSSKYERMFFSQNGSGFDI